MYGSQCYTTHVKLCEEGNFHVIYYLYDNKKSMKHDYKLIWNGGRSQKAL